MSDTLPAIQRITYVDPIEGIDHLIINHNVTPKTELVALSSVMGNPTYENLKQNIHHAILAFETELHFRKEAGDQTLPAYPTLQRFRELIPKNTDVLPDAKAWDEAISMIGQAIVKRGTGAFNGQKTWVERSRMPTRSGNPGADAFSNIQTPRDAANSGGRTI